MKTSKTVMNQLLMQAADLSASDLHLTADSAPRVRLAGKLTPLEYSAISEVDCKQLILSIMTVHQRERFEQELEIDFGFEIDGTARFRANVFMQRGCVAAVFRVVPFQIRTLEELRLPRILSELSEKKRGLVLVTGPSGSGKSTTLASMIDTINTQRKGHIITVEDPVEFLHPHRGCLISQREVSADVRSFAQALRMALREDPDVVLVGEMRDLETVSAALRVAETGHLTLATLHTNSAQSTISRIIDIFPANQQEQVRRQLSQALEGIVCQRLIPEVNSGRRVVATEILIPTVGIRKLIREGEDHQIYSLMQTGQDKFGMHTMNQSLVELLKRKKIDYESAVAESPDISELREILRLKGMAGIGSRHAQRNTEVGISTSGTEVCKRELVGCLFSNIGE